MKAYALIKSKMMNLYRNISDFYVHVFLLTCANNYFFFLVISLQCLTLHLGLFVPAVVMAFVFFWRRISLPGVSWGARQNPQYLQHKFWREFATNFSAEHVPGSLFISFPRGFQHRNYALSLGQLMSFHVRHLSICPSSKDTVWLRNNNIL